MVKTPYGLTEKVMVEDVVKQGTVLGSPMCSCSTAEYCSVNKGVSVGTAEIGSLNLVDDMLDISGNNEDACKAHENAVMFSKKKKQNHKATKCKSMPVNTNKAESLPL